MNKSVLQHLREQNNLVQVTFARRAGTSQGYVSDVENGRRGMTPGFAMKAAPALGVDPVLLLAGHEYEKVAQKAEENDPAAPREALALAQKLLEILEEPGALDEEVADEVREIVGKLLELLEGVPVAGAPVVPEKPLGTKLPATKATGASVLERVPRAGVLDEDEILERISGLDVEDLQDLADQVQTKLSSYHAGAAERANLERIYDVVMLRIAELTGDGDRSSFRELAGDRAAAIKAAASEAQERRDYVESMREIGLDTFGRPLDPRRQEHARTLKSSEYDLTQDEIQTGVSSRGLPLIGKELERRRRI